MKFKNRFNILYLVSSLIILMSYLISTNNGNKKTPDSEGYISMAKNFSSHCQFSEPDKEQLFYWPPLYPIILSFNISNIPVIVRVLHLIVFIASVLIWITIARNYLPFFYLSIYSLFLCLSTPLLMIHVFMWSEAIFLFLLSGYLLSIKNYLEKDKIIFLGVSTLLCFCLLLQRHAGIFIVVPAVLGFLAYNIYSSKRLFLYCSHFILGISGWIIWNLKAKVFGKDQEIYKELLPYLSFKKNFELVFKEIGLLFFPFVNGTDIAILVSLAFFILMFIVYKNYNKDTFIKTLILIITFYLFVWIIIPASRDDISRFIAVILPFLYLVVSCFLVFLKNIFSKKFSILIIIILTITFSYQTIRIGRNILRWGEIGKCVPF